MALGTGTVIPARTIWAAMLWLLPTCGLAEGIDTEHIYGFMIGSDVGDVGEREFQATTTGLFFKQAGAYQAYGQQLELEFVPVKNFRIEIGTTLSAYDIAAVPGFVDRTLAGWQGAALDLRYRFLDRDTALFGLTLAMERNLIPGLAVATLNLGYQPEWTHFAGVTVTQQDSTLAAAFGIMAQVRPDFLLGGEVRYFRKYDGIGLQELAGEALFVGPTAYFRLSERARLTATWSIQAWGHPAGTSATLDLVNFERQRARLVFGLNF